jgi:hypothetical protein
MAVTAIRIVGTKRLQETRKMSIEADLSRLETGIRQLKIEYDMFFAGAKPLQPASLRTEIESLIRRTTNMSIQRYADRFHFNSLVSRFNSLSELWGKTIRSREEGERPIPAVENLRQMRRPDPDLCTFSDTDKDRDNLKKLHARYLSRRQHAEGKAPRISFENFVKGVSSQAKRLRKKSDCEQVELRILVEDNKVHLRARPGKS